jgi:hypothetical protein
VTRVTRLRFVAGPVRRKRRFLVLDVGPVRRRRDTPTAAAQLARPRITPHARSQIVVFKLQDNQAARPRRPGRRRGRQPDVPLGDGALAWSVSDDVGARAVGERGRSVGDGRGDRQARHVPGRRSVDTARRTARSFAGTLDVEVVVGPAVSIDIVPGEPRDATP